MKKVLPFFFIIAMLFSLSSCKTENIKPTITPMSIRPMNLSQEEKNILQYTNSKNTSIFQYTVDSYIKFSIINIYILDGHNKWKKLSTTPNSIDSQSGLLAVTISNNQDFSIVIKDDKVITNINPSIEKIAISNVSLNTSSICIESKIETGKEIPLTIKMISLATSFETYDMQSFYDTTRLDNHDIVYALTVTFSETRV